MKFILGRKVEMVRVFDEDGRSFAVTKIAALPCRVTKIMDKEKDKYKAVQISAYKGKTSPSKGGSADKKEKIVKISEFREDNTKRFKIGDKIEAKQFNANEKVTVEGTGKGKGFAGTIKRHSFAMGPVTHGSKNVRKPGSIGGGYPERVVKGRKMAGRMGGKQVTIKNLRIVDVEDDIILIAGAVPGPKNSIVKIYGKGEKAEEVIDHAAEEEKLAQEKMLEADKAEKPAESRPESVGEAKEEKHEQPGEQAEVEEVKPEEPVEQPE